MATITPESALFETMLYTKQLLFLLGFFQDSGDNAPQMSLLTDSSGSVSTINDPVPA